MKKTLLILIAILTISLTSCNSDDPEPSKKELLTDKKWKLSKTEIFENGDFVSTSVPDNDTYVKFNTDNTGKTTIDGESPSVWTWAFSDSESKITITEDGEIFTINIDKLTSSKFTFSYTGETSYKIIQYFKH